MGAGYSLSSAPTDRKSREGRRAGRERERERGRCRSFVSRVQWSVFMRFREGPESLLLALCGDPAVM